MAAMAHAVAAVTRATAAVTPAAAEMAPAISMRSGAKRFGPCEAALVWRPFLVYGCGMPRRDKTRESDPLAAPDDDKTAMEPSPDGPTYSLGELAEITGIAYGTLTAYLRAHPGRIPSQGVGRARRFPAEAAGIVQQIRKERYERLGQHWRKRSRPLARWEEQRKLLHRVVQKATALNELLRELQATVEQSRPEGGDR
jgi:hypothetical protein